MDPQPPDVEQINFLNSSVAPAVVASDSRGYSAKVIKNRPCVILLLTLISMSVLYLTATSSSILVDKSKDEMLLDVIECGNEVPHQEAVVQNVTIDTAPPSPSSPSPGASTCIFILSTPGSGSSTMVELVSQCHKECEITGENWGSLHALSDFHERLHKTEKQNRPDYHAEIAWKKVFDYNKVQEAERELVYSMLNPNHKECWGFKEIRYGRPPLVENFARDIEYLSTLCDNPKFIFHSREDAMKEKESSVIHSSEPLFQDSVKQHSCFNSYTQTTMSNDENDENGGGGEDEDEDTTLDVVESIDGCVRTNKKNNKTKAFRFFLEDYLNDNDKYQELWEYLECKGDRPHAGSISVLTKEKENGGL